MLLLITERSLIAQALTRHLNDRGIFFYHASMETALYHYEKHDVGGVFLDCTSDLGKASALCYRLRTLSSEVPICALVSQNDIPNLPADLILRDENLDAIRSGVLTFCLMNGWDKQPLRYFSLSLEPPDKIYYMGYPLTLPPCENTILRCLFYRYPRLTPTEELMSLCFSDELISTDNLFLHIGLINRRAAKIDPRPLIVNVYGKGYRLRDDL